ncbi:hypothetical protein GS506_17990 [Rhodococcus hoagii]|nr:hypothetical protein [Prescottella equi]
MAKKVGTRATDLDIASVGRRLVSFFVRRKPHGVPQTYELQRMFMSIVEQIEPGLDAISALIGDAPSPSLRPTRSSGVGSWGPSTTTTSRPADSSLRCSADAT